MLDFSNAPMTHVGWALDRHAAGSRDMIETAIATCILTPRTGEVLSVKGKAGSIFIRLDDGDALHLRFRPGHDKVDAKRTYYGPVIASATTPQQMRSLLVAFFAGAQPLRAAA